MVERGGAYSTLGIRNLAAKRWLDDFEGLSSSAIAFVFSDREELLEMPKLCEVVLALNSHWSDGTTEAPERLNDATAFSCCPS